MGYTIETIKAGKGGKVVRTKEKVSKDKEAAWKSVIKEANVKAQRKKKGKRLKFAEPKLPRFSGKAKLKKTMKPNKVVVEIKQHEPAAYIPIYMKEEIQEDKRQFFFNY